MNIICNDALAVVRKIGQPSFPTTAARNPNWAEVRSALPPQRRNVSIAQASAREFSFGGKKQFPATLQRAK